MNKNDIKNDIIAFKSNIKSKNFTIRIYPGFFKQNYGTYSLKSFIYHNIENKIRQISNYSNKKRFQVYNIYDKKLIVNKDTMERSYMIEHLIKSDVKKNFIVCAIKKKMIGVEQFPLLDKYHNVEDLIVEEFSCGQNNNIIISCIQDNYNEKNIFYLKIEFQDSYNNIDEIVQILEIILKEIS